MSNKSLTRVLAERVLAQHGIAVRQAYKRDYVFTDNCKTFNKVKFFINTFVDDDTLDDLNETFAEAASHTGRRTEVVSASEHNALAFRLYKENTDE